LPERGTKSWWKTHQPPVGREPKSWSLNILQVVVRNRAAHSTAP
jgi:hypothetical protein